MLKEQGYRQLPPARLVERSEDTGAKGLWEGQGSAKAYRKNPFGFSVQTQAGYTKGNSQAVVTDTGLSSFRSGSVWK